ncbi:MAG: gliding motility-associated C-terminal domain-containing protein [Sphingobacteriales bacterium]|nr:gliding motility-associated C-terminal domain-containing protein [Sphingobacteriales bacterium]
MQADRDTLEIFWGDGSSEKIWRTNGPSGPDGVPSGEVFDDNETKKNIYKGIHVYPGAFPFYVVSVLDPNRISNIVNINFGESVNIPFYIEDTLFLPNPQFYGYNNSPILYQPPIDHGAVGEIFIHNPNAWDIDGDSLYFEFIVPKQATAQEVPAYRYLDEVMAGADNVVTLDPHTGELIWNTPQQTGIYNIAILIREYRSGEQIGTMVRDMQIFIDETTNRPPEIAAVRDTCIFLGEQLTLQVSATDPNIPLQPLHLTAYGGPLELDISPATFTANNGSGMASGTFQWQTVCAHVFSSNYTVVFKAQDDFINNLGQSIHLVDLETWQINVVAPPPYNLTTQLIGNGVQINWEQPYVCQTSEKFYGFSVWRKEGCDSTVYDRCQQGMSADDGYILLAENINQYTYTDNTAKPGFSYTYRIVAHFSDVSTAGNYPLNTAQSVPSAGVCVELPQNIPLMTQVSVINTDVANGVIAVTWTKPDAIALDTLVNTPPYTYELLRADGIGGNNFVPITSFTANTYSAANDTTYTDTALNTEGQAYTYRINFYVSGSFLLGSSEIASSVRLEIAPTDNQNNLTWQAEVPWQNYEYVIYRSTDGLAYDSIATTIIPAYEDRPLTNGKSYCYYIEAKGSYFNSAVAAPLLNNSQRTCATPIDNVPPCAPTLAVSNDCDSLSQGEPVSDTFNQNRLDWAINDASCWEDISGYIIYTAPTAVSPYIVLDTLEGISVSDYVHTVANSLAVCYYVAAYDSAYNVSNSNIVCKDACLEYELPNTFTPNGDGDNELFVPRRSVFVSSIDLKIYNRWGNLVFETSDPAINWNGTDQQSGKELAEGVYFYVCDVLALNSISGESTIEKQLSGYIELLRGKD